MTIDKTLDAIMKLDYASREIIYEVLHKRLIEEKRKRISSNAAKSKKEFSKNALKTKSASKIIKELNSN